MLGLKVTPKKVINLFFRLLFEILYTFSVNNFFLSSFDLITAFIIDKFDLNLFEVSIIALVSLGKQEPPYAGPALKNLSPIR